MAVKKKKRHSLFKDLDKTPECQYSNIIWYCLNSNNRWNFVQSEKVKYLKEMTLDELKPDYIQLYNMIHQYIPENEDMKDMISEKYNKIISILPGAVIRFIDNPDNKLTNIRWVLDIFQRYSYVSQHVNQYYHRFVIPSARGFNIMCEYAKYLIFEQITHNVNLNPLLHELIKHLHKYDEIISVYERKLAINEIWELFLHSENSYCSSHIFNEFLKNLNDRCVFKKDFEYIIDSFKIDMSASAIVHCSNYISKKYGVL